MYATMYVAEWRYVSELSDCIVCVESLGKTKKSPGGLSPLVGVSTASSGACSTHKKTDDPARRHIAMELLQTEKNFVDILDVIVKVHIIIVDQLCININRLKHTYWSCTCMYMHTYMHTYIQTWYTHMRNAILCTYVHVHIAGPTRTPSLPIVIVHTYIPTPLLLCSTFKCPARVIVIMLLCRYSRSHWRS